MELIRGQRDLRLIQEHDRQELREMLQAVVRNENDIREIQTTPASLELVQTIEEVG